MQNEFYDNAGSIRGDNVLAYILEPPPNRAHVKELHLQMVTDVCEKRIPGTVDGTSMADINTVFVAMRWDFSQAFPNVNFANACLIARATLLLLPVLLDMFEFTARENPS